MLMSLSIKGPCGTVSKALEISKNTEHTSSPLSKCWRQSWVLYMAGYVAVALTKVQMASKEGEVSLCMRARVQVCKL